MLFFYNICIRVYQLLIFTISPFYPKAKQLLQGRKKNIPSFTKNDKVILVHCSSLGEYEQAVPVLKEIKSLEKKRKIVISFSSPSGYLNKKNDFIGDYILYLPLDTKSEMKRFISKINPEKVLLIKYEFWPNMLLALKEKSIPIYSISSIFIKNHYLFRWYGKWNLNIVKNSISHFFVQDQQSKKYLKKNKISNVTVVGDTRYDRVVEIAQSKKEIKLIKEFKGNNNLIVCGSTWPKDVELILHLAKSNPELKIIIAPHEMIHLKDLDFGLKLSMANKENISRHNIIIIDSIGLLSSLYQYGDVAYVGGGFNKGIHNTLEAISHGKAVIFGPKHKKFIEAVSLIERGYAKSIANKEELIKAYRHFINESFDSKIKTFCSKNSGASSKITTFLFS